MKFPIFTVGSLKGLLPQDQVTYCYWLMSNKKWWNLML